MSNPVREQEKKPERARKHAENDQPAEAYVPMTQPENPQRPWWRWLAVTGAIAAGGAGLWWALQTGATNPPAPGRGPAVVHRQESKVLVYVPSQEDRQATEAARRELRAGRVPEVLRNASPAVRQEVLDGTRGLYTFQVVDTQDEDGDIVRIALDGADVGSVYMKNAGTVMTIPLRPGARSELRFTAQVDGGGGGVTFGAHGSDGKVTSRTLLVGESETWVVAPREQGPR